MRLAEKTIELNFCAQASTLVHKRVVWFGLTQRQEAAAGFDAITKLNGTLLIFQFKASNNVLRSGARQFVVPHDQMQQLIALARHSRRRSVFYVLPALGESEELRAASGSLVHRTWLLDVTDIPPVAPPTRSDGAPRRSRKHYIDLIPPLVIIHSDPVSAPVVNAAEFVSDIPGADGVDIEYVRSLVLGEAQETLRRPRLQFRKALGMFIRS
jgi:hypothetical protein